MVNGKPVKFPHRAPAAAHPGLPQAGRRGRHARRPAARPTVFRRLPRLPHGKWQSVEPARHQHRGPAAVHELGRPREPADASALRRRARIRGALRSARSMTTEREELLDGVDVDGQRCRLRSPIGDGGGEGAQPAGTARHRRRPQPPRCAGCSTRSADGQPPDPHPLRQVVLPRGLKRGVWVDLGESNVRAIRRLTSSDAQRRRGRSRRPRSGARRRAPRRARPRLRSGSAPAPYAAPHVDDDDAAADDLDLDHGPIPESARAETFDGASCRSRRGELAASATVGPGGPKYSPRARRAAPARSDADLGRLHRRRRLHRKAEDAAAIAAAVASAAVVAAAAVVVGSAAGRAAAAAGAVSGGPKRPQPLQFEALPSSRQRRVDHRHWNGPRSSSRTPWPRT